MVLAPTHSNFAIRLLELLQKFDYRIAQSNADKEEIYRLRYNSYLREGAINSNSSALFNDVYDEFDNCWILGIYLGDKLASSLRLHVISPQCPTGPAMDVFPDIVGPMIHDQGLTLIDPTRFVADFEVAEEYPEIPFLTLRTVFMAVDYFKAEISLATVRKEHAAFYHRVFASEVLSEPRPYPSLKTPIALLGMDVENVRNKVVSRYPVFESSFTERRTIFEKSMKAPDEILKGSPENYLKSMKRSLRVINNSNLALDSNYDVSTAPSLNLEELNPENVIQLNAIEDMDKDLDKITHMLDMVSDELGMLKMELVTSGKHK